MSTPGYLCGEVKSLDGRDGVADPSGEFEVVLSAPTLDRDGEIIDDKAFDPLPDHITFDIDHGLSTATTVGSGAPYYEDGALKVKGTFSSIPRAQEVRTLITEGHIRTTSVAFMGAERETKDGVPHIIHAELLNGAFVPVPSNRQALIVAAKAAVQDAKTTIQSMHDQAVTDGAVCTHQSEPAPELAAAPAPAALAAGTRNRVLAAAALAQTLPA